MKDLVLNNEMLKTLAMMKGKTFKSYERDVFCCDEYCYGILRINLGEFAVDITNYNIDLELMGEANEIPTFACEEKELGDKFDCSGKSIAYMVDEKIKSIEIITDDIEILEQETRFKVDRAIIITTNFGRYSFYKGWHYGELIYIDKSNDNSNIYSIEAVKGDWSNDGQYNVSVERTKVVL